MIHDAWTHGHKTYETLPLTLSRAFENSVLCKIYGPKKEDVTMDWRKLHNKDLHELKSSPNVMRMLKWKRSRWFGRVTDMRGKRNGVCGCVWEI